MTSENFDETRHWGRKMRSDLTTAGASHEMEKRSSSTVNLVGLSVYPSNAGQFRLKGEARRVARSFIPENNCRIGEKMEG